MTRLTGWDFFSWMGLRRVNRGGLAKLGEHYFDGGRPVPGFLVDTLPPDIATAEHPSGELCIACVIRFAALLPPELSQRAQRGDEVRRG
jgi:hypothetical protein